MAYTFSRRNFMKYTALAAAAVAVSGSLTGCSNPNQPSGVFNGTADVQLSFGGSNGFFGIGGSSDYHTLLNKGTSYDAGKLTCTFKHFPISDGTSCTVNNYQLRIIKKDDSVQYVNAGKAGVTFSAENGTSSLKPSEAVVNELTVSGLTDLLADAKSVYIQYFPRHNALGNENDAYSDVYATWEITKLIVK